LIPLCVETLKAHAAKLDLEASRFAACLDDEKDKGRLAADMELSGKLGVSGTPGGYGARQSRQGAPDRAHPGAPSPIPCSVAPSTPCWRRPMPSPERGADSDPLVAVGLADALRLSALRAAACESGRCPAQGVVEPSAPTTGGLAGDWSWEVQVLRG